MRAKKRTTWIIVAGVRIWPIAWRTVLIKSLSTSCHLAMLGAGTIALLSVGLRAPGISEEQRQIMARGLASLGVSDHWRLLLPLVVSCLYIGEQIERIISGLLPDDRG